nr:unnamed protein product [Callosobruchus analis]
MGSRKKDVHDKQGVRKILVVGDELARNVARWLSSSCLSEADFRTSDAIIVIFKSSNVSNHNLLINALKKLLPCSKYTNLMILVQYNRRDDTQLHNFISKKIESFKAYNLNSSIHFETLSGLYGKNIAQCLYRSQMQTTIFL